MVSASALLFDFGVITIFARETLEGGIIIGEYRTVILRSTEWGPTRRQDGITQKDALRAVTLSAVVAAAVALVVCFAIAIPLAVLSRDFNKTTAIVIEGASKIVAAICILQLSLKMPKFFGLYGSKKSLKPEAKSTTTSVTNTATPAAETTGNINKDIDNNSSSGGEDDDNEAAVPVVAEASSEEQAIEVEGAPAFTPPTAVSDINNNAISIRSIRFNVAWNIWREVAECGVFLIPYFLTGDGVYSIPLSAVIGVVVGSIVCLGIYYANHRLKSTLGLTIFTVTLLLLLSTGLFSGGCHKFEMAYGFTPIVYELHGDFWDVERLPMTIFKPFGYSDTRTVLQLVCYWTSLFFGLALHYRKWRLCRNSNTTGKIEEDSIDQATTLTPALTAASLTIANTDTFKANDIETGMRRGETADSASSTSLSNPSEHKIEEDLKIVPRS